MASTEQWRGKPATCDQFPRCQHVRAARASCTVGGCVVTPLPSSPPAWQYRADHPELAGQMVKLPMTSPGVVSPDRGPARPVGPDSPQGAPH